MVDRIISFRNSPVSPIRQWPLNPSSPDRLSLCLPNYRLVSAALRRHQLALDPQLVQIKRIKRKGIEPYPD